MESRHRGERSDKASDQRREWDQQGWMGKTGDTGNLHGENAAGFEMDIAGGGQPQDTRAAKTRAQRFPCGGGLPETRRESSHADSPPGQRQAGDQAECEDV